MNKNTIRAAAFLTAVFLFFSVKIPSRAISFTDGAEIGSVYQNAVSSMTEAGILEGFPEGDFRPLSR